MLFVENVLILNNKQQTMNAKFALKTIFISILCLSISMQSCKKKDDTKADPDSKQHNEDVNNIKSTNDNTNNDVNNLIQNIPAFGKNTSPMAGEICGATIDSSDLYDVIPTLYINFDSTVTCPLPNRKRSGTLKVELISGTRWSDVGAVLKITHINYKVLFPDLANHYVVFNGSNYLTDVNGIDWIGVWLGSSTILLRERSYDMVVTFDNGESSSWQTARTSEWGYTASSGEVYAIVNGDTTMDGKTADSWGVTRFGTTFKTYVEQAWRSNTTCGWWRPTAGIYSSVTSGFTVKATFGTDASGVQIGGSGCAYGFKIEWDYSGTTGSTVLGYW